MSETPEAGVERESALLRLVAPRERSVTRLVIICVVLLLWTIVLTILYAATGKPVREERDVASEGSHGAMVDRD